MTLKMQIQLWTGSVAFIVWSIMAYNDPALRGAYLTFIITVVTTLSALVLRDMPTQGEKE